MPKIKKTENDENKCPAIFSTKQSKLKMKSAPFKFDMKQILKNRKADDEIWERSAELDKQIDIVDKLFQKEVDRIITYENNQFPDLPKSGYVVFDSSKYNNILKNNFNFDVTNTYLQRLYLMSIEENELEASIHFYKLKKSNWLPVFDDIKNILINWGTDVDTLLNKPLIKCQINYEKKIKHNFVLVIKFITECIQKSNNNYSINNLLTLAKFAVTISFDYYYGQMKIIIKRLFSICIEKAFQDDDDITSILSFSQELYSKYKETHLLNMVVDLFLPLEGDIMKKIYTYLSFKLYKSFLGKTNNLNAFPSNINDWFVQDLVNINYFSQNPKKVLTNVIYLLEHVVVILDLYKNEEKLSDMYDFLYTLVKPVELSKSSLKLVNILDQWRLHLFRIHINRHKMFV